MPVPPDLGRACLVHSSTERSTPYLDCSNLMPVPSDLGRACLAHSSVAERSTSSVYPAALGHFSGNLSLHIAVLAGYRLLFITEMSTLNLNQLYIFFKHQSLNFIM